MFILKVERTASNRVCQTEQYVTERTDDGRTLIKLYGAGPTDGEPSGLIALEPGERCYVMTSDGVTFDRIDAQKSAALRVTSRG